MIRLKVLSTVAAIALLLPVVVPTASFAQNPNGSKANAARAGGSAHPGGGMRPGGAASIQAAATMAVAAAPSFRARSPAR